MRYLNDHNDCGHNHYDHLDIASLSKLSNINNKTIFLVPEGDKKLLVNENIKNTFEFKWWDNFQIYGTTFTFTPAKHWSARGLFDESRSLWGSYPTNFYSHQITL